MIYAVAAIFRYHDKVFVIKRQNKLRVFPGYYSFPGGKVDAADRAIECTKGEAWESCYRIALEREVLEECGISLKMLEQQNIIQAPQLFGVAISPPFNPYKFETYYYLIEFSQIPEMIIEVGEIADSYWETPEQLLSNYFQGKIFCVPPFYKILRALRDSGYPYLYRPNCYDFSLHIPANGLPKIEPLAGIEQFFVQSPTLYPARYTNAFLIDGILVDPSPIDLGELKKLEFSLQNKEVRSIFITHFHGDHLKFADTLAKKLNVPILMSERCAYWLRHKQKPFDLEEVRFVHDGDKVGQWQNQAILVMAIPGHSDDHLALYSKDLRWFLAGDLFQYGATVVISDEEGDMLEYQQTLAKIIDLAPEIIFPSHGIGVGGTVALEKNLKHSRMRTQQVRKLKEQGYSEEEMLEQIYGRSIPQDLYRYAHKNIRSHLKLLGGEK